MRIAIVNDMAMSVEVLRHIVLSVPHYTIAWVAVNGKEAVEKCALDTPDLILMDLLMPVMEGTQATYHIMKETPCAILIVTASVTGNSDKVFEAMGYGALDVVKTPLLDKLSDTVYGQDLLKKLEMVSHLIGKGVQKQGSARPLLDSSTGNGTLKKPTLPPLVLLGASTGGPKALARIVASFPANCRAATVIIQHIDQQFAAGFVEWLGTHTPLPVMLATNGCTLQAGTIVVAGTNDHLIMNANRTMEYTSFPTDLVYRPSVDVFFTSVAKFWPEPSIAALLTGMGKDGAKGLKALHEKGWHTIAQDAGSCIVYGMPRAAVALGGVTDVLALDGIGTAILSFLQL